MKISLIILCLLISTTIFAQEDWGSLNKNKLTLKEIAPIWPGCEAGESAKRDACFDKMLVKHVGKNFKYPAEEYKKNIQGKVVVKFIINTKGLVEIKSAIGGNKGLQEAAKKNILSIPKMKPGMYAGKPSAVAYTVPFNFKTGK
ncbi:MAG: protein TonB [Flavobacteriaceae bacterium]|jgi:protein TonB